MLYKFTTYWCSGELLNHALSINHLYSTWSWCGELQSSVQQETEYLTTHPEINNGLSKSRMMAHFINTPADSIPAVFQQVFVSSLRYSHNTCTHSHGFPVDSTGFLPSQPRAVTRQLTCIVCDWLSVSVCLPVCLSACLSLCLFVRLSVRLSACLCLSVCLSVYVSVYVCVYRSAVSMTFCRPPLWLQWQSVRLAATVVMTSWFLTT